MNALPNRFKSCKMDGGVYVMFPEKKLSGLFIAAVCVIKRDFFPGNLLNAFEACGI